MTEGPPPSAASTSKVTIGGDNISQKQLPTSTPSSYTNGKPKQQHAGKTIWPTVWPAQQDVISSAASQAATSTQPLAFSSGYNPYGAYYQPHTYYTVRSPKPVQQRPSSNARAIDETEATRSTSPVNPTTYKDWDDILKKFLLKTKMTETLRGFESDMLVLNSEWEQRVMPGALKEMVAGLQDILKRIAGKARQDENAMDVDSEVNIMDNIESDEINALNERKLKYVHLSNGVVPRSQSSINKSISEFLSRTRARNDASNRAEFLFTLAEKKRKMEEGLEGSIEEDTEKAKQSGTTSCARVDAKKIDRDKQIKYDIAKYGEGPLITTVKSVAVSPPLPSSSEVAEPPTTIQPPSDTIEEDEKELHSVTKTRQKRKLVDSDEEEPDVPSGKPSRRSKRRTKDKKKKEEKKELAEPEEDAEEKALSLATAEKHPGIDDRMKNVEAHLAVRFVPTPPRTLLSRLVLLEDHIIKLEKEYPPWAALHFNQPNRGWPPPPRTTPIIVPTHLRTFATTPAATLASNSSSSTTPSATPVTAPHDLNTGSSSVVKPKKIRSSLHKAVLERMEVQRAISEMGGKSG